MPYPPNGGTSLESGDIIEAAHVNDIVTELGVNPKGDFGSVMARLDDVMSRLETLEGTPSIPSEPDILMTSTEFSDLGTALNAGGAVETYWNAVRGFDGWNASTGGSTGALKPPADWDADITYFDKFTASRTFSNPRTIITADPANTEMETSAKQRWLYDVGMHILANSLWWLQDNTAAIGGVNRGEAAVEWLDQLSFYITEITSRSSGETTMDGDLKLMTNWFMSNAYLATMILWDHTDLNGTGLSTKPLKIQLHDWIWEVWLKSQTTHRCVGGDNFGQNFGGWNGWLGSIKAQYWSGLMMKRLAVDQGLSGTLGDTVAQDALWRLDNALPSWIWYGATGMTRDGFPYTHVPLGTGWPQMPFTVDGIYTTDWGGSTSSSSGMLSRWIASPGLPPHWWVGQTQESGRDYMHTSIGFSDLAEISRTRRLNGDINMMANGDMGVAIRQGLETHAQDLNALLSGAWGAGQQANLDGYSFVPPRWSGGDYGLSWSLGGGSGGGVAAANAYEFARLESLAVASSAELNLLVVRGRGTGTPSSSVNAWGSDYSVGSRARTNNTCLRQILGMSVEGV